MPFYNVIKQYIDDSEKDKREAMYSMFKFVTIEYFKKGQFIFKEYDTNCEKAYVIIKGRVGVTRRVKNQVRNDPSQGSQKKEVKIDGSNSAVQTPDVRQSGKILASGIL